MTSNVTFKASDVFSKINLPFAPSWKQNAVVEYITDYFGDVEFSSIDDLVRGLQMAHYSAGSLGMCYTHELDSFVREHLDDIEDVLAEYIDAMGEKLQVETFSDMVVLALDYACNEIAHAVEYANLAIVASHADYMDTDPEVIICDTYDADDMVAEIIQHRLDMEVQHSTETVTQEDVDEMEETLLELVFTVV